MIVRARLIEAMAETGLDTLLVYGNAWQVRLSALRHRLRHSRRTGAGAGSQRRACHALSRQPARGRPCPIGLSRRRGDPRARSHRRGRRRAGPAAQSADRRGAAAPDPAPDRASRQGPQSHRPDLFRRPSADGQDGVRDRRDPPRGQGCRRRLPGVHECGAPGPGGLRADRRSRRPSSAPTASTTISRSSGSAASKFAA